MAIVIPDLFGAFQKGREYAIDRNWKDLENYETIEKMRNANDMAQLALLQERYYTPLKMNMFANNADNSEMQSQIQFTAYPGALSNARQFTNQAISNEGVQRATLPDTEQTQVATTLANNRVARGEATEKSAYAGNVDWEGKGKANAGVTNFKAGNALANVKIEQDIFKKSSEEKLLTLDNAIATLRNIQELQPLLNQIENLKAAGKYNEALTYLIQAKGDYERIKIQANEGGYASVGGVSGSNGQAIKYVNPAYKDYTNEALGALIDHHTELVNNPKTADASKAISNDILRAATKEAADRGIDITNGNQSTSNPTTGRGTEIVSPFMLNPYANQNRTYQIDYRVRDEQGRLPIDYSVGVVGQGQQAGVGVRTNPTNYTGTIGNNNLFGIDINRYIDPANFAGSPQDLSGGGQPQQSTYQSPTDADLAAYEDKIRANSKIGAKQKNRILGAINLQRNSSLFNTWGGIVGENDQYRGSVLVNGRPIPYSTNTAVNLTALGNNLTPLQRELKQSLLLSGEFPVKTVNRKLEFNLDKLFPRIENNQVLTKPLIYGGGNYGSSSSNPRYK